MPRSGVIEQVNNCPALLNFELFLRADNAADIGTETECGTGVVVDHF